MLSRLLRPLLHRVFPSTKEDAALAESLSANICANFLGLGNAATPMGIQAAQRMKRGGTATDELCRLIVLNTASIQLIPANVAAVRSALGCATPFDILPAVWVTSCALPDWGSRRVGTGKGLAEMTDYIVPVLLFLAAALALGKRENAYDLLLQAARTG